MARYRHVDLSPRLLPVDLASLLVPSNFAHTLHQLIDGLVEGEALYTYCAEQALGAPPQRKADTSTLVSTTIRMRPCAAFGA